MDFEIIRNLAYLVAAVLFIFGIKGLTHPRTAVRGNIIGGIGMLLAAVATIVAPEGFGAMGWVLIAVGIAIGTIAGFGFGSYELALIAADRYLSGKDR